MTALLKDYPLKGLTDSRTAMAERLRDFVLGLEFRLPKTNTPFKFVKVYEEWAEFRDRATSGGGQLPAAAILPDRPIPEEAAFGPRIIESTWSGGDPELLDDQGLQKFPIGNVTGDGFALFEIAQRTATFLLIYRTKTRSQRRAIQKVLEEAFVEDGSEIDPSRVDPNVPPSEVAQPPIPPGRVPDVFMNPVRYGRLLKVPRYFDRKARFTLISGPEPLDTEASVQENRWLGQVEVTGHIQICTLRRVPAMSARVELVVDGTTESR